MKVGVYEHKAKKGVIRTTVKAYNDVVNIRITGDFMVFPEDVIFQLESRLSNIRPDPNLISNIVDEVLSRATLFGCTIDDFKTSIMGALREVQLV